MQAREAALNKVRRALLATLPLVPSPCPVSCSAAFTVSVSCLSRASLSPPGEAAGVGGVCSSPLGAQGRGSGGRRVRVRVRPLAQVGQNPYLDPSRH